MRYKVYRKVNIKHPLEYTTMWMLVIGSILVVAGGVISNFIFPPNILFFVGAFIIVVAFIVGLFLKGKEIWAEDKDIRIEEVKK